MGVGGSMKALEDLAEWVDEPEREWGWRTAVRS
jgi:hypothetical protein